LRNRHDREGSDAGELVAPGIGNLIEQHGCVAEASDRPLVALIGYGGQAIPFTAVALWGVEGGRSWLGVRLPAVFVPCFFGSASSFGIAL